MGNLHISSFQPDVRKVSLYGSDLNQSIETNRKGVSITGILSLDAQDPLTTNILECPSLSIMDNLTLSVMDTSNKAMKDVEYTYDTQNRKGIKVEAATMFDTVALLTPKVLTICICKRC